MDKYVLLNGLSDVFGTNGVVAGDVVRGQFWKILPWVQFPPSHSLLIQLAPPPLYFLQQKNTFYRLSQTAGVLSFQDKKRHIKDSLFNCNKHRNIFHSGEPVLYRMLSSQILLCHDSWMPTCPQKRSGRQRRQTWKTEFSLNSLASPVRVSACLKLLEIFLAPMYEVVLLPPVRN